MSTNKAANLPHEPSASNAAPEPLSIASPKLLDPPEQTASVAEDTARKAGRGGLAVAAGKVNFILLGLVQQIALKAILNLDGYGALSSALSMASITYNPIVSGSIQGVSWAVAGSPDEEQGAALRQAMRVHSVIAVLFGVGFFFLAPPIATWFGAPHITGALRILSVILFVYGIYTPLVGALNGKKSFLRQAALDLLSAFLRTFGLLGGAYWFSKQFESDVAGIEGAAWGFVLSATLVLLVAISWVGLGRKGRGGPTLGQYLSFIGPLFLGQLLLNLLLQADLNILRYFAADAAREAGLGVQAADPLVGAYRAVQLFCFLPYQLLIAITFILFPMLASAHRDGRRDNVAHYVQSGVRLALVLAGLMVSVTSGLSGPLLRLLFGADTAALGARTMQLLTLGFGAFAIFGILTTVLNSLKRERAAALVTALALVSVALLGALRLMGTPFGEQLLFRTAVATSAGVLIATLSAGWLVKRTAGALVSPLSLGRVVIAAAVSIALARHLPEASKVMTLVYSALVGLVYVLCLILLRELGKADVGMIKAVVARRAR